MNWFDYIALVAVAVYGFFGYVNGFIRILFQLVIFVVSVGGGYAAVKFGGSDFFQNIFRAEDDMAKTFGFVGVFFILMFGLSWLGNFVYPFMPRRWRNSTHNRLVGLILGALKGAVFVLLGVLVINNVPVTDTIRKPIKDSKIGQLVYAIEPIKQFEEQIFGTTFREIAKLRTVKPLSDESIKLDFKVDDGLPCEAEEQEMYKLVNKERLKNGLNVLGYSSKLRDVGRAHSADMFARSYFSHNTPEGKDPFDRMDEAGIVYSNAGENLALAPSVKIAHQGFVNSPGHRENLLRPEFGNIGIGCIDGGIYGKMFSQEFTN